MDLLFVFLPDLLTSLLICKCLVVVVNGVSVCVYVCFFQAIFLASGTSFVAGVYVDREMANGARVGH